MRARRHGGWIGVCALTGAFAFALVPACGGMIIIDDESLSADASPGCGSGQACDGSGSAARDATSDPAVDGSSDAASKKDASYDAADGRDASDDAGHILDASTSDASPADAATKDADGGSPDAGACSPSTCVGCCQNGVCRSGKQTLACGTGGAACADCEGGNANATCQSGTCALRVCARAACTKSCCPAICTAGDFDGDGHADLLVRDGDNLRLFRGTGAGGLVQDGGTLVASGFGAYVSILSPGDFDGDGKSDVLVRDGSGFMRLFPGNGAGGLQAGGGAAFDANWGGHSVLTGARDWDGDGFNDMLAKGPTGQLLLCRGTGAGGFVQDGGTPIGSWPFVKAAQVGDLDGDGNPDLVAQAAGGALFLCRGNGCGGLAGACTVLGAAAQGYDLFTGVGDFDGDGAPDLVARLAATGALHLFRGDGAGALSGPTPIGNPGMSVDTLFGVW